MEMMRRSHAVVAVVATLTVLACMVPTRASAQGCVADPIDGTCWTTRSILRLSAGASAYGRTARCTIACELTEFGSLLLFDDGAYSIPAGRLTLCPTGDGATFPDEVGTTERKRRRRLALKPANLDDLSDAAAACFDELGAVFSYHAHVTPSPDGTTLRGKGTLKGRVSAPVGSVHLKVVAKVTGASFESGLEPPPPSRRPLPACTSTLTPKCRTW